MQVIGELMLTLGVLALLFAFYEAYWTNIASGKAQAEVSQQLDEEWKNPRQRQQLELGEAFARMYIPSFGQDFQFAIVEGTDEADLLRGPGRYSETQMPGERGNFAVAGHRVGKGAPFNDLGNLKTCDAIVIETQDTWDVYRVLPIDEQDRLAAAQACMSEEQAQRVGVGDYADVDGRHITTPGDISVIAAKPGTPMMTGLSQEELDAYEPVLTLTTCHPQFSDAERMIVHAIMTEQYSKEGAAPDVLEGN